MEIKLIKYKHINFKKYDECIQNSTYSRVEAFSWYLDIVTNKKWEVFVYGDYEVVMPIPYNVKYFIKYVYTPFWVLQLGIFGDSKYLNENNFYKYLFKKYKLVDLRLNIFNKLPSTNTFIKKTHQLDMNNYEELKKNFRSDRKKDLKKAIKNKLSFIVNHKKEKFLELYFKNIKSRSKKINQKDCGRFSKLFSECIAKDKADLLSVYDEQNKLVAGGLFLKNKDRITILVSATDLKNRKNGANTFLVHQAIEHYRKEFCFFDFGGSSIPSIANYFLSMSATEKHFYKIKMNNLPLIIKLIQKIKNNL